MSQNILITGGPILGETAIELAKKCLHNGDTVSLLLPKSIKCDIDSADLSIIHFENQKQFVRCIEIESQNKSYDVVIHSSDIAGYKPEYFFCLEDIAKEIAKNITDSYQYQNGDDSLTGRYKINDLILKTLKNPECKLTDADNFLNKPDLTVKLCLVSETDIPLNHLFPRAFICTLKSLENIPKNELTNIITKQINTDEIDLCFVYNNYSFSKDNSSYLIVDKDGCTDITVKGANGIYNYLKAIGFR